MTTSYERNRLEGWICKPSTNHISLNIFLVFFLLFRLVFLTLFLFNLFIIFFFQLTYYFLFPTSLPPFFQQVYRLFHPFFQRFYSLSFFSSVLLLFSFWTCLWTVLFFQLIYFPFSSQSYYSHLFFSLNLISSFFPFLCLTSLSSFPFSFKLLIVLFSIFFSTCFPPFSSVFFSLFYPAPVTNTSAVTLRDFGHFQTLWPVDAGWPGNGRVEGGQRRVKHRERVSRTSRKGHKGKGEEGGGVEVKGRTGNKVSCEVQRREGKGCEEKQYRG